MQILSESQFDKAAEFITRHARPLERALFEYHFNSGTTDQVLDELKKFQNQDGGFGYGVEPDIRMPHSSALVTSVAFQVIREISTPASHEMVRSGIAYLKTTFNRDISGWEPVPPQVDDYGRAPWWNYKDIGEGEQISPLVKANPGAEIVGYLHMFDGQGDSGTLSEASEIVLSTFDELPDDIEEHAMMCFIRLAEMAPDRIADRLEEKLRRGVRLVSGKTAEDWQGYGGRPLWLAPTPASLLADELVDPIQNELDFLIDTQTEGGSWQPFWQWGQYEEEEKLAKVEWAGWLTLRNLQALRAWGRIDEM